MKNITEMRTVVLENRTVYLANSFLHMFTLQFLSRAIEIYKIYVLDVFNYSFYELC